MDYFRVNAPNVIHEIIDGEAVVVNLQTGSYYSIDKIGALVWEYVEKGLSLGEIVDIVARRYDGEPGAIDEGIRRLFGRLQEEGLIAPLDARPAGNGHTVAIDTGSDGTKAPFEPPVLHKYTDMEDLLLLDPIHDVDETGWPNVPDKK